MAAKRCEIRINGTIGSYWDGVVPADVVGQLRDGGKECVGCDVIINSPGGVALDGVAIYNELRTWAQAAAGRDVAVRVRGLAASAASIVAMAGDTVTMEEGSFLMIHNASGLVVGTKCDMEAMADLLGKMDGELAGIYSRACGKDVASCSEMMDAETWMTALEAVECGFADEACVPEGGLSASARIVPVAAAMTRFGYRNMPGEIAAMVAGWGKLGIRNEELGIEGSGSKPVAVGAGNNKKGESDMSDEQVGKTAPPVSESRAATVGEIKAACSGAGPEFIVAQMEAGATLDQVKAAWAAHLAEQVRALAEENERLKAEKAPEKPGVPALGTTTAQNSAGGGEGSDPAAAWHSAVNAKMAGGMARAKAVAAVVREMPELHAEYVAAANGR